MGTIIISSVLIFITNYKFVINKKIYVTDCIFTLLIPFDRNTVVKIDQFCDVSSLIDNKCYDLDNNIKEKIKKLIIQVN